MRVFGFGATPELNRDGKIVSHTKTVYVVGIFLVMLWSLGNMIWDTADFVRMSKDGVAVTATVVSNRTEKIGGKSQSNALLAYTPMGITPQKELRAELPEAGAYEEGSAIEILYDPTNPSRIQLIPIPLDWIARIAFLFIVILIPLALGRNLLQRLRGEIVYARHPDPDAYHYVPTPEEDAEFDRNQAAGTPSIMGEVNGKWGKLKGKAQEDAQKEFRAADRAFLSVGLLLTLLAIGGIIYGLTRPAGFDWFALIGSIILLPLGAAFAFSGYMSRRQGYD